MFDNTHYVPILKWKKGEQDALNNLKEYIHGKFTPLIEIPSMDYDYEKNQYKKTIDEHITRISSLIKKTLNESTAFVDFKLLDNKQLLNNKISLYLYEKSKRNNLMLIPVVSPNSSNATTHAAKNNLSNGLCFRVSSDYFDDIESTLLKLHQNYSNVPLSNIDLIIDMESIFNSKISVLKVLTKSIIDKIPHINKWRTLTLSSSAFPIDLSCIKRDTIGKIPRLEWSNWNSLIHENSRIPTFSDYPIAHPEIKDLDFRLMSRSASIRYSDDNDWIIIKGKSIKTQPQAFQYKEKSKILISLEEYFGDSYSWGDTFIYNCAKGGNCGSATTWRQVGVNHHITLAVNQLSNLF